MLAEEDIFKIVPVQGTIGYILNYVTSEEGGTHWYALYIDGRKAFIFDSLGAPPDDTITKWANENNVTLYTMTDKAQSNNSTWCGLWAIWFHYMINNGYNPQMLYKVIHQLKTYEDKEDMLVSSLV